MHSDAGRIAASAERAALMALFYRAEFTGGTRLKGPQPKMVINRVLVIRAAAATLFMIALFFGVVPSKVPIIIRGLLLLTRRVMSRRFYEDLDWSLLLMFAGLSSSSGGPQHALLTLDVSPPSAVFISIRLLSERRHRRSGQQSVGDADIEAVCRGAARLWQGGGSRSRWRRRSPATSTVPGSIVNLIVEETGV